MRTFTQTTLVYVLLSLIFSCKKDNALSPKQQDESYYRRKLTEMIHLSPVTSAQSTARTAERKDPLRFDNYQQAYEFFHKLLSSKDSISIQMHGIDSVPAVKTSDAAFSSTGTQYQTFTGIANNTVVSQNSWGSSKINAIYKATTSVAYTYTESNGIRTYTGKQPVNSTVTDIAVVYSGVGAIESQNFIINALAGGGTIVGNMQGVVHIGDTELSFYITWTATYGFTIPALPTGMSVLNSTLTSSAH
ncbi:hypothetical protein HGH93_30720 [Chitinophaga polysaccharea]|uniref:hypothetical protein n=1 Tax=Chitinophaga TaxID=79328 RepID=UPI00145529D5|nr:MULTISPECIES: hypothetical protein [Chitinophaga]NLR62505.1 hypothetical protein [Chitinophaga polysaccharea]NLU92325.1 hypothetical protein [Chitinophaga sp. Ak27]